MHKRGTLLVIEGGDASGKATQTALLRQQLEAESVPVEQLDFPQYENNQTGQLLRECLDGKHGNFMGLDPRLTSILFATDRRESLPKIEAWLAAGQVVILDRYTSANMLHQGAKLADSAARKETMSFIYRLEHEIMGLPLPDAVIYLAVPAAVRLDLLQKQYAEDGRVLDVAEVNEQHQLHVDDAAESMLSMYQNTHVVDCMEKGALLHQAAVADMVLKIVHGILKT